MCQGVCVNVCLLGFVLVCLCVTVYTVCIVVCAKCVCVCAYVSLFKVFVCASVCVKQLCVCVCVCVRHHSGSSTTLALCVVCVGLCSNRVT